MRVIAPLVALMGVVGSLAAPTSLTARMPACPPVAPNTACCLLSDSADHASEAYSVMIGRSFAGGAGCEPIRQTINQHIGYDIGPMACEPAAKDNTYLSFSAGPVNDLSSNERVLAGLQEAYPMVPFTGEQTCQIMSTKVKSRDVIPGAAKCSLSQDGEKEKYDVEVGMPFNDGAKCNAVHKTLRASMDDINHWSCEINGRGSTHLEFSAGRAGNHDDNERVQDALFKAYPNLIELVECKVPMEKRDTAAIPPDSATCYLEAGEDYEAYDLFIGRPFAVGSGCKPIEKTISDAIGYHVALTCENAGNDNTHLGFKAGKAGDDEDNSKVMAALNEAYPTVDFPITCIVPGSKLKARDAGDDNTPIPENATACWPSNNGGSFERYEILIGRDFNDGAGCEAIKKTLADHVGYAVKDWECETCHEYAGTHLGFSAGTPGSVEDNEKVIAGLHEAYPMVDFEHDLHHSGTSVGCRIPENPEKKLKARDSAACRTGLDILHDKRNYDILIPRPFMNGAGCNAILNTITAHASTVDGWICEGDDSSGTHLNFYAGAALNPDDNLAVIAALEESYTGTDFDSCEMSESCEKKLLSRDPRIAENTAVCTITAKQAAFPAIGTSFQFRVQAGRSFNKGKGCDPIKKTLTEMIPNFDYNHYTCDDDENGDTLLQFGVLNADVDGNINKALGTAYPDVQFEFEKYCHDVDYEKLKARQDGQIELNTATCDAQYLGGGGSSSFVTEYLYTVHIGRSFNGGGGCDTIWDTLVDVCNDCFSNYDCDHDDFGDTILTLVVTDASPEHDVLNRGLAIAYPDIPFIQDDIC